MYTLDRSVPFYRMYIKKYILQVKKNLEGKNYKLASYREKVPPHFKVLGTISLQCFMIKLQAIPSISWIISFSLSDSVKYFSCACFLFCQIAFLYIFWRLDLLYDTMVLPMRSARLNHECIWLPTKETK